VRRLGDALGAWIIVGALAGGVVLAVASARLAAPNVGAPPSSTTVPTRIDTTLDLSRGDRAAGRVAFRSQCQECHTQGRQSFDLPARGRVAGIRTRVREGAGEMPAFSVDRLGDDVLLHVLAYISTPSEPEKKEAPEPRIRGINMQILDAAGRPGERPIIRFVVRDDKGVAFSPSEMSTLALTVGGPTVDYRWALREDARRGEVLGDGSAQYTFTGQLPADASGTFAVGLEAAFDNPPGAGAPQPVREFGYNAVQYFAVTDSVPVPPRMIVKTESCNECHGTLATHGGSRRNTELCVICHNATNSDNDKRTAVNGPMPPEPILFRNLVHRIHTGEDLSHSFTVIGGNPANPQPADLTTLHPFPKDRANCALCHEPGTFNITRALESQTGIQVSAGGEIVRQMGPVTAACTGCHDSDRTLAHASSQLAAGGAEACATCHGAGRPFSPVAMHRIAEQR
jgi:OmcA/MtrC family decaheme c-type cytochrome